jgi:hypothetical protein
MEIFIEENLLQVTKFRLFKEEKMGPKFKFKDGIMHISKTFFG